MLVRRQKRRPRRAAFTLLEVLLVLAIIGVIAALAVPQLLGRKQESDIKAAKIQIKTFERTLGSFALDHDGVYPEGDASTIFGMLMNPGQDAEGRARNPYLDEIIVDPWGIPLMYEYGQNISKPVRGNKPAIWSAGPDRQDGTDDDIGNWSNTDL